MMKVPKSAEVIGAVVAGYLGAYDRESIEPHLEKYQLQDVDPNEWYPLYQFIETIRAVGAGVSGMQNLVSWAMRVGPMTVQQAGVTDLKQFFGGIEQVYNTVHRGEGIGYIRAEFESDEKFTIKSATPYPDHFEYGIYYSQVRTLLPEEIYFMMEYDESVQRRDMGGAVTHYKVEIE